LELPRLSRMFNCKESIDSLLPFLEGEMSPEDEEHLRQHLSGCPPCVEFVNTYRATSKLCRKALVKSMPPEVAGRLRAYLRGKLETK
jgi:anti-sigma factor (TIGR02949 family)